MKRQIVLENDQLIEMVNESARRVLRRLMMENRYDLRGARVLAESDNWMDDHTGGTEANNVAFKNWEATARQQGYSDAYINAVKQINDWVGGGAESNGLIDWSDGTPRVNEKAVAEFSDGDNSWFARNNSAERQEWYNALRAVIDREDQTRGASMALNNMVDLDAQIAQLEQDVAANPDNPGLQMNLEMLKQRRAMFQPTLQNYYDSLNAEAAQLMSGITNGTVANTPENQAMLGNMQQTLFMLNQNAYPYLNIPQASTTQDQAGQDQTQNQTSGQTQNTNNLGMMNNNWGWGMNFGNGNQAGYNWLNYNQSLMPGVVTTDANGNQVTTDVNGNQVTLTSPNAQTTNTTNATQGTSQTNTRTTSNAGSARPAATNTARATNNARATRPVATNTRAARPAVTNTATSTVNTATSTPTVSTATSTPTVEPPASYNRTVTFNPPASQVRTEQPPQQQQPQPQPQPQQQQQPQQQPKPQPQQQQQPQQQPGQPTVTTGGQTGGQQVPGRTIQSGALNTTPNRYVAGYNSTPTFNPKNVRPVVQYQNPYQQPRR